jgi:hypothetical protein
MGQFPGDKNSRVKVIVLILQDKLDFLADAYGRERCHEAVRIGALTQQWKWTVTGSGTSKKEKDIERFFSRRLRGGDD